ncbi:glycosyltransferase family 1 protein [Chitinivibrio alkaliphilus]|uniref:Glycosyltransferase superfamily protein n=1 Tax=Chitinivibrio alkaliphilus ACht1 TaxID=1313304 RepID=U7DC48_9BACT|nr:glycosyltransferase family 1 protein [Chitinivibrio alkaliphilus]ERP31990.1 glycosyltransferase superfamily protein [Chitinivibrio alkaliphilus ACht1]
MKIVVVHYHMRRGGVRRIIEQQISLFLQKDMALELVLYTGDAADYSPPEDPRFSLVEEPLLDYASAIRQGESLDGYLRLLRFFCDQEPGTLFHVHNSVIGKNPRLNAAIVEAARAGCPFCIHCHDFVEDRPALFKQVQQAAASLGYARYEDLMYPQHGRVYWVCINKSDLSRSPLSSFESTSYIPNPVEPPPRGNMTRMELACSLKIDETKSWYFYPVRAIERKNIGEFILLSQLIDPEGVWLISREPETPEEREGYEQWRHFSSLHTLPLLFNAAKKGDFGSLYEHCTYVVTTSVMEGFGLVFLESFLAGKPLLGRNIPAVTEDFCARGVVFSGIYDVLLVPAYGVWTDFACLSRNQQMQWLEKIGTIPCC